MELLLWKDLKWSRRLLRKHNLHHTWRQRKHLTRPTNKPTWNSFSSLSGNCSLAKNQLPTANYLPVLMVILQNNLCKLSGMSLSVVFTSLCRFYFPWSMFELVATRICASWIAVPETPDKPFSYLQPCAIRPPKMDDSTLALCLSPTQPVPASFVSYSHDWPSHMLAPRTRLLIILIFRSEHLHQNSLSKLQWGAGSFYWFPW